MLYINRCYIKMFYVISSIHRKHLCIPMSMSNSKIVPVSIVNEKISKNLLWEMSNIHEEKLRAHWYNSMHSNLPCVEKSKEKLVMCIKMFNGFLLIILKKNLMQPNVYY